MLNAIAIDIRNKHRKRIQRHNEKQAMHATLKTLGEKKSYLEEQIHSYHSYIDASMQTMQGRKGKKRFVLPFSQQYFHLRSLKQNGGKVPKFGSYKYSAAKLLEKGVLVSIDGVAKSAAPDAAGEVSLTISSDQAGVFTIEVVNGPHAGLASDLRIEDLLEAQFNNATSLNVLDGTACVNVNLLVHLINKKFYA
jgi:Ras GTPase-activating-like protein IQGAP2/3